MVEKTLEQTLFFIKPDRFNDKGEILDDLCQENFNIICLKEYKMTLQEADEFYKSNRGKSHHQRNIEHVSSGNILIGVIEGKNVVQKLRKVVGATNPKEAEAGTIRYKYGTELPRNAIHASDSNKSATREMAFFGVLFN